MGNSITASHDVHLAVSDRGLDRVIRGAFVERVAPYGLPWPVAAEVQFAGNPAVFEFRFGAPSAAIRPADFDDPFLLPQGKIGIRLPFRDSTISGQSNLQRLNGELQIALPVVDGGVFAPDLSQAEVRLVPAADDPDPSDGDRTTADKMGLLASLLGPVLAAQLQNGSLGLPPGFFESALFDLLRGDGACPIAADGTPLPTVPVVRPPRVDRLQCADAEERGTALLIKGKASDIAVSAGRETDPAVADLSWSNPANDVGVVISNRLLMQELMPSAILPALVGVDRVAVRQAAEAAVDAAIEAGDIAEDDRGPRIRAAEDAAIATAIAPFFRFPMTQIAPVPMSIPLPTIDDMIAEGADAEPVALTGPNATLAGSSFTVFPGGGAPSVVRAVLPLSITAPDVYTATVTADIAFAARDGALQVEPAVSSVDVTLPGLPDGIASLFLNLLWDPILNQFVDWFGEGPAVAAVDGQVAAAVDTGTIGRELRDVLLVREAVLDDLTFQGDLRIQRDPAGGQRDRSAIVERTCLDEILEAEEGLGAGGLALALEDGEPVAVDVASGTVAPAAGTSGVELTDLGVRPFAEALNVGLTDLHAPAVVWTSGPVAIGNAGPLGPPIARVIGVRDSAGRHARIVAWIDLIGRHRVHLVRYRRVLPGLVIRERPNGAVLPADPSRILGWDPAFRAMYVDLDQIPGGSVVVGRQTPGGWSESIDLPRFVGRGPGTNGLAMGSAVVGVGEQTRRVDGALLAVPTMLNAPVGQVTWAVRDIDGIEHALPAGETLVDLGPASESNVIRCTVDAARPSILRLAGEDGRDVDAEFIARVEHGTDDGAGRPVIESRHRLRVSGVTHRPFGFDRWLEDFERAMMILATIGSDPDPIGPRIRPVTGDESIGRADPAIRFMDVSPARALVEVIRGDGGRQPGGRATPAGGVRAGRPSETPIDGRPDAHVATLARARATVRRMAADGVAAPVIKLAEAALADAERAIPSPETLVGRARERRNDVRRTRGADAADGRGRPGGLAPIGDGGDRGDGGARRPR